MKKGNVVQLPDFTDRCILVASKKFTKLSNAKHWLRDQHSINCDGAVLRFYNPDLK